MDQKDSIFISVLFFLFYFFGGAEVGEALWGFQLAIFVI